MKKYLVIANTYDGGYGVEYHLFAICNTEKEAIEKGIVNTVASCTLMIEMGRMVYSSPGSEKNIKLTTPDDIEIFKALLNAKKDEWMK